MKIDRVHFYVEDAIKTRDWFVNNIGFRSIYSNNNGHTQTEAISYNSVFFLLSSPLNSSSPVADYLQFHPPGIVDVAFQVKNLNSLVTKAEALGTKILQYPQNTHKQATIAGWGTLQHTVSEANTVEDKIYRDDAKIVDIDHIVLNVPVGQLNPAVDFYRALFGFEIQQTFNIKTKRSGLYSQALIDPSGRVQFNINEPTSSNSQIQEFLDYNNGAGIQHLALRSHNLIDTVAQMRDRHITFLNIPDSYYHQLKKSSGISESEWLAIKKQQILVHCDRTPPQSLLMQIFTQPIFDEPTFFLEFIERRHNAKGFGQGNFQALFEAVEREQLPKKANN
ncbi:MAG: 4-hydroxyphenylpyruvate dioxygenase [Pleurocapsa sp.]